MSNAFRSVLCPLCCEEDASTEGAALPCCNHRSCKSCLARWFEREEASGTRPTCPFCRLSVSDEEVIATLGRPFRPRLASIKDASNYDGTIDDLTLQWLNEKTVLCEVCGSRIEKEGGCDLMECLCGYRFCYRCGAPGGRSCGCSGPGHNFLNRHYVADEPIRDGHGRVDLMACIQRSKIQQEREDKMKRTSVTLSSAEEIIASVLFLSILLVFYLPAYFAAKALDGV